MSTAHETPFGQALGAAIERVLATATIPSYERTQGQLARYEELRGYPTCPVSLERIVATVTSHVQTGSPVDLVLVYLEAEGGLLLGARVWPTSVIRHIVLEEVFGTYADRTPTTPLTKPE